MAVALGLDIGTSKVAAVLIDAATHDVLDAISLPTHADLELENGRAEQDVDAIWQAVVQAINGISPDLRQQVVAVGVTGQMHGVVLWNDPWTCSSLITWQDQRCLEGGYLQRLRQRTESPTLAAGYGCATLAWLAEYAVDTLRTMTHAGTIHGLVAARLRGDADSVMDATDAAAWGLYDWTPRSWSQSGWEAAAIPRHLMPKLMPSGAHLGRLDERVAGILGLVAGTPVAVPTGDNPAATLASVTNPATDLLLNLGTGGQLAAVTPMERVSSSAAADDFEWRPYVDDKHALAVGVALCGGRAMVWLVDMVEQWLSELDLPCPERGELYRRINECGMQAASTSLQIQPTFAGVRGDSDCLGQARGLTFGNFGLGDISAATARGLLVYLKDRLPASCYEGRTQVIGSGNALRRSALLREMTETVFGLPLTIGERLEEAATGAAILALRGTGSTA